MTAIPALEKIQGSKCNTCLHEGELMCGTCGITFCTKHMLSHTKNCNNYRAVIREILRDDFTYAAHQVCEAVLRIA
ncbi:MAG: hypothetical protein KGI27_08830 [Thaumarchaeota archaeon]|nr:hypothetical protein [Nitrososphaerota archaeon]